MIGPAQNMYLREATNSGRLPNLLDRFQKLQEVGVDLIRMRGGEAVRQAWIKHFLGSLDEFRRFHS
jgi:methionine synthase II (cobalamin-independent)